jgi:predicted acylesterase/phospholipase RssA
VHTKLLFLKKDRSAQLTVFFQAISNVAVKVLWKKTETKLATFFAHSHLNFRNSAQHRTESGWKTQKKMAATAGNVMRRSLALSLTGSGHLLIYQLGACQILHQASQPQRHQTLGSATTIDIDYVVGASGGAIAATLLCRAPESMDDYAQAFIEKRGGGLELLREFLLLDVNHHRCPSRFQSLPKRVSSTATLPELHIAVTRCVDGKGHTIHCLSSSPPSEKSNNENSANEFLLKCVEASCRIPPSCHPWDALSNTPSPYPEENGIVLDDTTTAYVDGGIATPAPPTPTPYKESSSECESTSGAYYERVIVTPLSGTSTASERISPSATTPQMLQMKASHDLGIDIFGLANLRALQASAGLVSSSQLRDWHCRGQEDATNWLEHRS